MATLTYAHSQAVAFIGPLTPAEEPHSWDLCGDHADRITPPVGWRLVRQFEEPEVAVEDEDDDLTAMAKMVGAVAEDGFPIGRSNTGTRRIPLPTQMPKDPAIHPSRREVPPGRRVGHLTVVPDEDAAQDTQ